MTISLANSKIAASMLPSSALKAQDSKSFNLAFARADMQTHKSNGETASRYPKNSATRHGRLSRRAPAPVTRERERDKQRKNAFSKAIVFTVENNEYTKTRTDFLV